MVFLCLALAFAPKIDPGRRSPYIVRGRMRRSEQKGQDTRMVADNLLHISSYRASNIIHTER